MVSMCFSLTMNDNTGHLLMFLFVFYISLVKCLFKFFGPFFNWLLCIVEFLRVWYTVQNCVLISNV